MLLGILHLPPLISNMCMLLEFIFKFKMLDKSNSIFSFCCFFISNSIGFFLIIFLNFKFWSIIINKLFTFLGDFFLFSLLSTSTLSFGSFKKFRLFVYEEFKFKFVISFLTLISITWPKLLAACYFITQKFFVYVLTMEVLFHPKNTLF